MRNEGDPPAMEPPTGDGPACRKPERVLTGLGVSPGLAVGEAHLSHMATVAVPEYAIDPSDIPAEIQRFEAAVAAGRHQLEKLKDKSLTLHGPAGEEVGYLLDAHIAMLSHSRLLRGTVQRITDQAINAEAALEREVEEIARSFAAIEDVYLAARLDEVRVVGTRLQRNLTKTPFTAIGKLPAGTILLADEVTPADTALMDPARIAGFAAVLGGAESHTAIMARAMGIPAVLGCVDLMHGVTPGDTVLIDGFAGTVVVNPSADTLADFETRRVALARERRELRLIRHLPSLTHDGIEIRLEANCSIEGQFAPMEGAEVAARPSGSWELDQAIENGAAGIGLLRTEFLYMNRETPPDEAEQVAVLSGLVKAMGGRPVTIRTLDVGGDKLAESLGRLAGVSANPALGLRAIRLSLKHQALLETQFSAILKAGVHGPVRILLPMISSRAEVRAAREVLNQVWSRLVTKGEKVSAMPPLGIMIEVPGTALSADAFAGEVDFFAIGTNDLTQYTLAIDRGDEQVAHLYNPFHPAVLRLIQFATEAAVTAGIPVSVCGEMAGDPRLTPLLIGLGIRSLSMAPGSLLPVKQRLRRLTLREAHQAAGQIMAETDEARILDLLDEGYRRTV
jgi:phosphotransferase system enzyme I (PtsI)